MAYLMPLILMTWMLVVFILFYYHDKNIIAGAAYETAVVGTELYQKEEETKEEELKEYFQNRVKGKMLFFPYAFVEIRYSESRIIVIGEANAKGMKISIEESAVWIEPEIMLRKLEMIKNGLERARE